MSQEQESYPKPPFEAAQPSEPLSAQGSGESSNPAQDAPQTGGFGGRGSADESAEPVSAAQAFPVPPFSAPPPFPAPESGFAAPPPVIGAAAQEGSAPLYPVPPFSVPPSEAPVAPRAGSIAFQEPGATTARPPTLAESRARYQAEQDAARQREIERLHEENQRKWRRRLIGGVAVVGIVGVVALVYIASPERRCYDEANQQEVPSSYCTSSYYSGGGGVGGGGFGGGGGVYIFHNSGWFGSSPYSGNRLSGGGSGGYNSRGGGYSSGGDSTGKSSSSSGGITRGGINPGGGGSSSS
ncbi:MAG: tat pathway signal sequence [Segniliparus sp.]|uniref:tat pathway signal sequence n=1 Tax=Segniliparus sp. TaxID=2804064 RepID=UPI003F3C8914